MGLKNIDNEFKNTDVKKKLRINKFIEKFIEKFPKAKLHTITQINKYCNDKTIVLDENTDEIITNNMIYNYMKMTNQNI